MIGYYVHHHGRGHLTRAACIAAALREPVTVLSSLPPPGEGSPYADWVTLPRDDHDPASGDSGPADPQGGGALHWAPLSEPGYRGRMAALAEWVALASPSLLVVDVSVEVTAFVRLLGVPVVVLAGPGDRDDPAHALAYRLATRIIAPWAQRVYDPAHLHEYADKVSYVGAISRFDDRPAQPVTGERKVLVLLGGGGHQVSKADLVTAGAATPRWSWKAFGGDTLPWTDTVWQHLQAADVVVTHAGQNAVAEVAAARRPAVLVPQSRPFDEQRATATALDAAGIAVMARSWPAPEHWQALLEDASGRSGAAWARWNPGGAAARAAEVVEGIVRHA